MKNTLQIVGSVIAVSVALLAISPLLSDLLYDSYKLGNASMQVIPAFAFSLVLYLRFERRKRLHATMGGALGGAMAGFVLLVAIAKLQPEFEATHPVLGLGALTILASMSIGACCGFTVALICEATAHLLQKITGAPPAG